MTTSISKLKHQYPGEWLAIRVTDYEDFRPAEGELVFHDAEWSKVLSSVALPKTERIYITYAGPLIPEGYAVAFSVD